MFLGKFARTLHDGSGFTVPPVFLGPLSGGAYLTQGFDRNLQVLTSEAFQEVYQKVASLNITDPLARLLLRLILGNAQELIVDAGGQMDIPEELKQFANLHKDILLIGQGEYFEIWAPDFWAQQEAQLRDAEANANRFSTLTVSARSQISTAGAAGSPARTS